MVNAKQIRIGAKIFGHLTLCLELFLKKTTTYNHGIIGSCLSFDHLRRFYAYFVSNSPKIGLFHRKPRTNFHFLPNLGEEILFLSFSRAILEVCFFCLSDPFNADIYWQHKVSNGAPAAKENRTNHFALKFSKI